MSIVSSTQRSEQTVSLSEWLLSWRLDLTLLSGLLAVCLLGLFVLYSASGQSGITVINQLVRMLLGLGAMVLVAQIPPDWYRVAAPWFFAIGTLLLVLVLLLGSETKGAQRWLDLGILRFQPSEIMKLAVPLTIAALFHERHMPPGLPWLAMATLLIVLPTVLVAVQPDLGTALLIAVAGGFVVYLSGLRWRYILGLGVIAAAAAPLLWLNMHEYQQERVLTFLNPARDPAGAGYHITQSKIAIGSGGVFGKGWLNGSQAQLDFLPESDTDFIFAVFAEELGLLGVLVLLLLYCFIVFRGLYIAGRSQDTFQRLIAGSLSLTFFVYVFVNIGMVIGLLPVVGVPLPLVSYGGTSMVMMLASFGILMSIHTHRKLLAT